MDSVVTQSVISTKMKLVKSSDTGYIVGFASRNPKTGAWRGVRQNSAFPKKVCVLDRRLVPYTLTNRLYDVTMIPMRNKDGFVIVEARPVMFRAKINTYHVEKHVYKVEVLFGGSSIIYDPMDGRRRSVKDLQTAIDTLRQRTDIQDINIIVEQFSSESSKVLSAFKREMPGLAIRNMGEIHHTAKYW